MQTGNVELLFVATAARPLAKAVADARDSSFFSLAASSAWLLDTVIVGRSHLHFQIEYNLIPEPLWHSLSLSLSFRV